MGKAPDFGQRQAKLICQMPYDELLRFIAEGLPILLESARGFWSASCHLSAQPREAEVLAGFAQEEAAKILILMDAVRCPRHLIAARLSQIVSRFYGHLERLIYAEVCDGWSQDIADLRKRVEPLRKSHYIEGDVGEYIVPNANRYRRESKLYADIEAYEDRVPIWNAPKTYPGFFEPRKPSVLAVAEAMAALGMFSLPGLNATAQVWGALDFVEHESLRDAERLTDQLVERLVTEALPADFATQDHVFVLGRHWPLPMYNVELKMVDVSLEDLKQEQDRILWAEAGY